MIRNLLQRIGVESAPLSAGPDDQTYTEAAMDNAIVDSGRTIDQLSQVAVLGTRANALLRAGIDRLKMSSADPIEVIGRIARRHPH
jgi:hypothetical protein